MCLCASLWHLKELIKGCSASTEVPEWTHTLQAHLWETQLLWLPNGPKCRESDGDFNDHSLTPSLPLKACPTSENATPENWNFYRVFLVFLAHPLNSNPHLYSMLPCPCPAAGEASRENPTGIRDSEVAGREGGGHPTVHRCALPWTCSAIQSWHHSSGTRARGHHTEGQATPIPRSPPDACVSVQGETVTFRWVKISHGFEQHLKEKGNFFPRKFLVKISIFFPFNITQGLSAPRNSIHIPYKGNVAWPFHLSSAHTQRGNSLSDHFPLFST